MGGLAPLKGWSKMPYQVHIYIIHLFYVYMLFFDQRVDVFYVMFEDFHLCCTRNAALNLRENLTWGFDLLDRFKP